MPLFSKMDWGSEFDRIAAGGLASTTETRLKELQAWGGFSSFLTPGALAAAASAEIEPVGQVVGLCGGVIGMGYLRTTRPGQGRARVGVARWRERTGPITAWTAMRSRALARLTEQATRLGAHAVVGVKAERRVEKEAEEEGGIPAELSFTGTAVRVRSLARAKTPVLTLASVQELWAMLRAGVEPAGVAGAFASVETSPSAATMAAMGPGSPNAELEDLTASVYEVRRLAMKRLRADARALDAGGLLGIDLRLEETLPGRARIGMTLSVHVLASAVRRRSPAPLGVEPVVSVSAGARG